MKMYQVLTSLPGKKEIAFTSLSDEANAISVAKARVKEGLYERVTIMHYENGRVVGDGPIWDSLKPEKAGV